VDGADASRSPAAGKPAASGETSTHAGPSPIAAARSTPPPGRRRTSPPAGGGAARPFAAAFDIRAASVSSTRVDDLPRWRRRKRRADSSNQAPARGSRRALCPCAWMAPAAGT
jgi:hypothetical protein